MIRLSHTLNRIRDRHRDRSLFRRAARPAVLGTAALVAIVAVVVAGCGGGSASSSATSGSSSTSGSGAGASQTSSFRKCLEQHGVTLPQGGGGFGGGSGGSGTPHPRPTGSAASSFKAAIQACGGSSGFHPGSAG